ncbi:uncharacterized protein LOC121749450 [Salvia splendens]|uniref:uncharacterized protein LOC121749450 n=1 Tax=Salvia splendens TaxID=180675 RepID=UPI001C27A156|nr:uncharacterized protein LOC121749450 [Salvia splendens]
MSKVHINIPLAEALQQMPNYAKFLTDVVAKKRKWGKYETVGLTENCSVIIKKGLPTKHKDPGSFTLSCVLGNNVEGKPLCDLGSSINLMPSSFYKKLDIDIIRPTSITLQMADRSTTIPRGIVEDVLEDKKVSLILGRPLLATGGAMIDVQKGEQTLHLHNEKFKVLPGRIPQKGNTFLPLRTTEEEEERKKALGKPRGTPKVELKPLPEHLRYAFLGPDNTYLVVVFAALNEKECESCYVC